MDTLFNHFSHCTGLGSQYASISYTVFVLLNQLVLYWKMFPDCRYGTLILFLYDILKFVFLFWFGILHSFWIQQFTHLIANIKKNYSRNTFSLKLFLIFFQFESEFRVPRSRRRAPCASQRTGSRGSSHPPILLQEVDRRRVRRKRKLSHRSHLI